MTLLKVLDFLIVLRSAYSYFLTELSNIATFFTLGAVFDKAYGVFLKERTIFGAGEVYKKVCYPDFSKPSSFVNSSYLIVKVHFLS